MYEVLHHTRQELYVMGHDFQRDFIWDEIKQSKRVESVTILLSCRR